MKVRELIDILLAELDQEAEVKLCVEGEITTLGSSYKYTDGLYLYGESYASNV